MLRPLALGSLFLGLVLASLPLASAQVITSDTEQIKTLGLKIVQAIEAKDPEAVGAYLTDNYVGVDIFGNLVDRNQRIEQLKAATVSFKAIDSTNQMVSVFGGTRVVTGIYHVEGIYNGQNITGDYRYVDVWVKQKDRWLVAASTLSAVRPVPAATK